MADIGLTSNIIVNASIASNLGLSKLLSSNSIIISEVLLTSLNTGQINLETTQTNCLSIVTCELYINLTLIGTTEINSLISGEILTGQIELLIGTIETTTSVSTGSLVIGAVKLLTGISETYSNSFSDILIVGVEEILIGSSEIISLMNGVLLFGIDENTTSLSESNSMVDGSMIIEVRCINCSFNNVKSLVKNGPKCFRTARFNIDESKTKCGMYKIIKGLL